MKKLCILLAFALPMVLQFCSSSKKSQSAMGISANYLHGKCVTHYCWQLLSCHIPPKGSKKAFDYYDSIRSNIDEIIARIEKQPDEKRFMPFKHPRLIDATIRCL